MNAITFSHTKKFLDRNVKVVDTSSFKINDVVSVKCGNRCDCDFSPYEEGTIVSTRESEFTGTQFLVHIPNKEVYALCTAGDEYTETHLYTTMAVRTDEENAKLRLGFN